MPVAQNILAEAVRLGLIKPDDLERFQHDERAVPTADPWDELEPEERLSEAIRACASGTREFDGVRIVTTDEDGRELPTPTRRRDTKKRRQP